MKVKLITMLSLVTLVAWMPLAAQESEPVPESQTEQETVDQLTEPEGGGELEGEPGGEGETEEPAGEHEPPATTATGDEGSDDYAELDELPQTASHLALTALLGIVGIASAYGLQKVRRK